MDGDGRTAEAAFGLLGDPTRMAILEALWDADAEPACGSRTTDSGESASSTGVAPAHTGGRTAPR